MEVKKVATTFNRDLKEQKAINQKFDNQVTEQKLRQK